MKFTFKLRRDTAVDWTTKNPVLAAGEPGVETDTGYFKIGNGVAAWSALPYVLNEPGVNALIQIAIENAVLTGVQGPPGADGADGADGESAYQIAVANGFVGTEAEWLASLVGPEGPQGIQGLQGDAGPQGIQGIQGVKGDTGDQGPQGIQGPAGADGADGVFSGIKVWNDTTSVYDVSSGTIYLGGPTDPTTVSGDIWIQVAP